MAWENRSIKHSKRRFLLHHHATTNQVLAAPLKPIKKRLHQRVPRVFLAIIRSAKLNQSTSMRCYRLSRKWKAFWRLPQLYRCLVRQWWWGRSTRGSKILVYKLMAMWIFPRRSICLWRILMMPWWMQSIFRRATARYKIEITNS